MMENDRKTIMAYIQENIDHIPYKTLRPGEQELSDEQKVINMHHTLETDPGLFLSKWGRYLSQPLLSLFKSIQGDYEVDYYLSTLLYQESPSQTRKSLLQTTIQNRRYEYLKTHLRHSDYFSDESIQLRDPLLYDTFVRQHIPTQETQAPFDEDITLVDRILSNMDNKYVEDHIRDQKIREEEQFQEEEEDTEDEEEEQIPEEDIEKTMAFRESQRLEMIRLLEEKFMAGKDEEFDYTQVDYNEDYDDLEQLNQDIQDRYFDSD